MSVPIHPSACILSGVQLSEGCQVGAFVLLGERPLSAGNAQACALQECPLPLSIGPEAIIRSHTVLYAGSVIGAHFQTGHHVLIREANTLGNQVSIGSGSVIEHHVRIGNRVRLHSNCFVPEFSILEDDVWLGPGVTLTNARYPRSPHVKQTLQGPHLKPFAKVGAGAVVLPGLTLGQHCLIGAGSVVVTDVPDYAIVAGNPARVLGDVREKGYKV